MRTIQSLNFNVIWNISVNRMSCAVHWKHSNVNRSPLLFLKLYKIPEYIFISKNHVSTYCIKYVEISSDKCKHPRCDQSRIDGSYSLRLSRITRHDRVVLSLNEILFNKKLTSVECKCCLNLLLNCPNLSKCWLFFVSTNR